MFISVSILSVKELNLLKFALDINRNMKNLGIKSLNIISDQDATIDSNKFGTIKILLNKEENQSLGFSSISSSTARTAHLSIRPILSASAIEMAKNLHELLLHIDNLPAGPRTIHKKLRF